MRNDWGPICRLGRVVLTPGARKFLSGTDMLNALLLHMRGGRASDESPLAPDDLAGCRTLNVYRGSAGQCFWIITETDRSLTTILMPEEF